MCVRVCVCKLCSQVWNAQVPYCHVQPAPWYHIFPHYLIRCTIFERKKTLLKAKFLFWFLLQLFFSETFLILRRTERYMIKIVRVYRPSFKVPVILVRFLCNFDYINRFKKKYLNVKFHENPSSVSRVVRCGEMDSRTDGVTWRN